MVLPKTVFIRLILVTLPLTVQTRRLVKGLQRFVKPPASDTFIQPSAIERSSSLAAHQMQTKVQQLKMEPALKELTESAAHKQISTGLFDKVNESSLLNQTDISLLGIRAGACEADCNIAEAKKKQVCNAVSSFDVIRQHKGCMLAFPWKIRRSTRERCCACLVSHADAKKQICGSKRAGAEAVGAKDGENGTAGFGLVGPPLEIEFDLEVIEVTSGTSLTGYEDISEKHVLDPALVKPLEKRFHKKIHQFAFAYPQPPHNPEGALVYYDEVDKMIGLNKFTDMRSDDPNYQPDIRFGVYMHDVDSDGPFYLKGPASCNMRPITPLIANSIEGAKMFCWEPDCVIINEDTYDENNTRKYHVPNHKMIWEARHERETKKPCLVYQMIDGTYLAYTRDLGHYKMTMLRKDFKGFRDEKKKMIVNFFKRPPRKLKASPQKDLAGHSGPWRLLQVLLSGIFPVVGLQF